MFLNSKNYMQWFRAAQKFILGIGKRDYIQGKVATPFEKSSIQVETVSKGVVWKVFKSNEEHGIWFGRFAKVMKKHGIQTKLGISYVVH